jgi:EmrB/QacA subfamily drug resistance transporter
MMDGVVATAPEQAGLRLSSSRGRWVLLACVLGSGLAGLDATAVNIALPAIGADLDAGFESLQWIVTAYTLTLASLILLGGAYGDRYGRRRIFTVGIVWFAAASLLCALAPTTGLLIAARALQGVGGALLTPASLAIIQASFIKDDRSRTVGAWAGFSGVAIAIAPFIGGWLLELGSWRWVFLINPPLAVVVIAIVVRHVPETRNATAPAGLDVMGAVLGFLGLGGITYAAISAPLDGVGSPAAIVGAIGGLAALVGFVAWERAARHPMLPLGLFSSRQFSGANLVTFAVYAALHGFLFLLVIGLQTVAGFSPVVAGSALLPITALVLAFSERSGKLAQRIGPRLQMTVGPLVCTVGVLMTLQLSTHTRYLTDVLPAMTVFGLGLAIMVAPLTAAVLAAAPDENAGIASGVNNAVARAAGLFAVATLPALTGLTGQAYEDPAMFLDSYRASVWLCAFALVVGAVLAALTISDCSVRPHHARLGFHRVRQHSAMVSC